MQRSLQSTKPSLISTNSDLSTRATLREFDARRLTPALPLAPDEIRALRAREQVSQAVFARYLNVTAGLVSQWERGVKRPTGPSLKLLALARER